LGILATNRRSVRITCDCGESFAAGVVRVINLSTDQELFESLLAGELNQVKCKHCDREFPSETPVYIHDPDALLYVCVFPSAWRSRELALRIEFYQELLGIGGDAIPGYVRDARFVFGVRPCADLFDRPEQSDVGSAPDQVLEEIIENSIEPAIRELNESDFEQVYDVEKVDRRDSAVVQRWRESGQDYYAFLDDGALHIFQRHPDPKRFGDRADIFFQLHRIENFPLVVLLLVAESVEGGNEVLYWLYNMDNHVDVKFVEQLATRFEVNLHLFDPSYVRRRSMVFSPSLSQNVEYVLQQAREWLEKIDAKRRNFFIAASKFDESAYDKLGRIRSGLKPEAFKDLPSPALTKLALDILTYWSSRENYEYLIFIKSFPVTTFKTIVADVLKRSIEFGLAMTEKMKRMAVEMGFADSKEELLQHLLSNYVEVLLGLKENDMDPASQWENWQLLVKDADELGVVVDPEFFEVAHAARNRMEEAQQIIPLDLDDDVEMLGALDQLHPVELADLLKDPENRAEAARVLAEGGRQEMFAEVVKAFRRMNRKEVDILGNALAGFGEVARDFLMETLHSESGTQAVGALRALVRLDGPESVPVLLDEIKAGRRGVWRDAAELIAGLDPADLPWDRLEQVSTKGDAPVRGRLVTLLSILADDRARQKLEIMAQTDPDTRVRKAARRAIGN
jgi:hypothetical protein